jgi:kumamolisin
MNKITLQGSERAALPAAHRMSGADPSEQIRVTILVRRHAREDFHNRVAALASGKPSGGHLTRAQFAARYGASAADLAAVRAFAHSHSLTVLEEHAARRSLRLAGSVAQFSEAFDVQLHRMAYPGGTYRGRVGAVKVPGDLEGIIEAARMRWPAAAPACAARRPASTARWSGTTAPPAGPAAEGSAVSSRRRAGRRS